MERQKGKPKVTVKALIRAIIQILNDNNVEPAVIDKIRALIS